MKKVLIFAGLAVLLVGLPLVSKMTRGTGNAKEVQVEAVESRIIRSSILASGSLAYREQVQLRSEVIAQVTDVHVEESDRVEKGQLVISLDTESYDAQVEQAEARVRIQAIAIERQQLLIENLERRHTNARELRKGNLVDRDSFDNLENELSMSRVDLRSLEESLFQARAALAQARDLLAKTQIVSPIDGIIIQVEIKAGETVIAGTTNIPGSTLMVVADTSEMLVEVKVDEADIAMVRDGQGADIFAAAYPDTPLPGVVESIAPMATQTPGQLSLSFLVKILLTDPDKFDVRSGMSARADIYTATSEKSLAVPVQAVRFDEEESEDGDGEEPRSFVFVFNDGVAERRDVRTGISSDSDQEILEGLEEGERVITGPFRVLRHLDDGDPVEEKSEQDDNEDETED